MRFPNRYVCIGLYSRLHLSRNISRVFSCFCILAWAFKELSTFGSDFGSYYANARFMSNDYKLYDQIFDHKGPFYFFILRKISLISGWGFYNSIYSLIC